MKASKNIFWLLAPVALLVFADEWFKYLALQRLPDEGSLVGHKFLAFAIHKNWGIAFDFPFRLEFILLFSVVIGFGLAHVAYKTWRTQPGVAFSACVIVIGALGNLYDRLVYGFTVDYLIFFGRSAINLSDIVIVSGAILLLLFSRRKKRRSKNGNRIDKPSEIE